MYEMFKGAEADAAEDSFVLLEWWADAAAIEAHMKTPHVQQGRQRDSDVHSSDFNFSLQQI